ncbi:hypothetical protein [Phenylobacterium sp.]|uniref:hypothetical protein n=1 Tax=Phenylobacterium sp. TaxID=1871053 RepID=UPI002FC7C3E0
MTGKFAACIADAAKAGEIDADTAADAQGTYDEAYAAASETLGPVEADRLAANAVLQDLEAKAIRARQNKALMVRTRRAALEGLAAYKTARGYSKVKALGGSGGKPPKDGWTQGGEPPKKGPYAAGGAAADYLKEIVDGNGGLTGGAGPSVKGRYQAVFGSFQAMLADLIDKAESFTGLPIRGKAVLQNVVRELHGEDTGDAAAKALADAFTETSDHARKMFNAAGGSIGKLEKWGLPQTHDPLAMRAVGRDGWVDAISPRLDRAKMVDKVTGLPFSDKRLRAVLGEVYDTILTMGSIDRTPGAGLGKGALANRRGESRFLIFKSADDWLAYAGEFGRGDPYSTMIQHLDGMARDIARMQVLGPNPDHQFEWLANLAKAETRAEQLAGAPKENALLNTDGRIKSAQEMYRLFVGDVSGPYGSENIVADVGASARAALSGIQLGSAVINDLVSNPVFAAQARAFAGLSRTGDFKAWAGYLLDGKTRETARRTGLIFELTRDRHAANVRRVLQAQSVGAKIYAGANAVARLLPTWINHAAFLEANRNAQRFSFQAEFMGHLADMAGQSLKALEGGEPPAREFAALLRARGFGEKDWDLVRATPPDEHGFLTPSAIRAAHDDELAWRVSEMIERETRQSVPEPSLWARAQLMMKTDPGTVQGEIVRSAASYRSFTVTQTYFWTQEFALRAFRAGQAQEAAGMPWQLRAATLAAPMLIAATISGAAAIWLKDISKGNDPRPLWDEDDPKEARKRAFRFLAQAAAQGGGQGILGDFLSSVEARNGKSSSATALGPALGLVSDTWNLTVGNANEALSGEETHAGREAARYAGRYAPLATLWWTRAAWNRAVTDQLQKVLDPEADDDFRRRARRMEREYGQGQWWPQGSVLPERAPSADVTGG